MASDGVIMDGAAAFGALLGAILFPMIKLLTPDSTACLYLFTSLLSQGPRLDAFVNCMIGDVLVGAIFGAIICEVLTKNL